MTVAIRAIPWRQGMLWAWVLGALLGLSGCAVPQVQAEDRLFLPLAVEFLDRAELPAQDFENTRVGGLSGLAYDPQGGEFYAVSDDRGALAPPRVYTLEMPWVPDGAGGIKIGAIALRRVTLLRDDQGNSYGRDVLDPEAIALSPRDTWLITSEGVAQSGSPPQINEYDRTTGELRLALPIPTRYLPNGAEGTPRGVRENLGFESIAPSPHGGRGAIEPFRLFTATESALAQDLDPDPSQPLTSRFLHYLLDPALTQNRVTLIAEHAYPLALEPQGSVVHGLTALATLDSGGHFLALERSFGLRGFQVNLWQLATGGATDTSGLATLAPLSPNLSPIRKQLLLDLNSLGLPVGNLEAMALGPPLPDGSQSLWLLSDDNFGYDRQPTQVWLFRLRSTR